jgi:hypothetical protein
LKLQQTLQIRESLRATILPLAGCNPVRR